MTETEILIKNVKLYCKRNPGSLTIGQIEREVGVSTGYFARCLAGGADMSLKTASKVALLLNTTLSEIVSEAYMSDTRIAEIDKEIQELQAERERILNIIS